MKRFIMWCLTLLLMLPSVTFMTGSAAAQDVAKPQGVRLALLSECTIDFEASVYWTGNSEDLVLQLLWLVSQLPEKCLERKCVFTDIDPDRFLLLAPRFLEKFKDNPQLWELSTLVITAFKDCSIAANPRLSSSGSGGGPNCGGGGNSLSLSVSGNNNTVSSSQTGCNTATIRLNGSNITVGLIQSGMNSADIEINGHDITFILEQYGQNSYQGTFTTPGVYHARQSN